MALGDGIFRSRAASLLRASTPSVSHLVAPDTIKEKAPKTPVQSPPAQKGKQEPEYNDSEKVQCTSLAGNTAQRPDQDVAVHNREAQRVVRTIPAWVRSLDENNEELNWGGQSLPFLPPNTKVAQHNNTPTTRFSYRIKPPDDSEFDHRRARKVDATQNRPQTKSRWKAFTEASAYPTISPNGGEVVTADWLAQYGADYSRPWLADVIDDGDPEKGVTSPHLFQVKRRTWYVRAQRTVLRSPIIPMVIRIIVWFFSAIALGLAASIHHLTNLPHNKFKQTASTNMAISVDAVAMVYLLYITYDEYSGKPLGLRSARAKMRLIFLDLFFIVFDSANLSLAFENVCYGSSPNLDPDGICPRQKGLASVLLIALIAWLLTFSISVMRSVFESEALATGVLIWKTD
ncbi:hypothetical protein ACLMJK_001861 [Lecanora helva]